MKRIRYTFPPGAVYGHDDGLAVDGYNAGPFVIHRSLIAPECGWRVTHRASGAAAGHTTYKNRDHALAFASWLTAAPIDWETADATELHARIVAAFPTGALWRAMAAAQDGRIPEPEYR